MLKKFAFSFFFLLSIMPLLTSEETPKEAWVMYATPNYFSLMEITLESAHAFSTRPIIAVGVNADIPFSTEQFPRLIKKRIDVNLENQFSIYLVKPKAILEAKVENGVYIDADILLNQGCDKLFEYCSLVQDHPLCPAHEKEAWVLEDAMHFFGVYARSMHYVHADVIVFSQQCKSFLSEWNAMCVNYPSLGVPCFDETFMNVLLWKYGATEQLPTIDPYNSYFNTYLDLEDSSKKLPPYSHWFLFHGNKDPRREWEMLQKLKEQYPTLL